MLTRTYRSMPVLIWSRLKDMKCPKCASALKKGMLDPDYVCEKATCDFSIGEAKFDQVVTSLYKSRRRIERVPEELDNLSMLNNFDRVAPTPDYSDRQPEA